METTWKIRTGTGEEIENALNQLQSEMNDSQDLSVTKMSRHGYDYTVLVSIRTAY